MIQNHHKTNRYASKNKSSNQIIVDNFKAQMLTRYIHNGQSPKQATEKTDNTVRLIKCMLEGTAIISYNTIEGERRLQRGSLKNYSSTIRQPFDLSKQYDELPFQDPLSKKWLRLRLTNISGWLEDKFPFF